MKITVNVSDDVINKFCEEHDFTREEVEEGVKDWMSYYEDDEFFYEDLKFKIMNI